MNDRITAPGFVEGLSSRDYHLASTYDEIVLSSSGVQMLKDRSPAHLKYDHDHPQADEWSHESAWGTAFDCALLTPDRSNDLIVRVGADNFTTKEAKTLKADALAAGLTPILSRNLDEVFAAVGVINCHPAIAGERLFQDGKAQVSGFARDPETGIFMKARPDYWQGLTLFDVKTVPNANPQYLERHADTQNWRIQAAWYARVWRANGVAINRYRYLCVERAPPFALSLLDFTPDALLDGDEEAEIALRVMKRCLDTGRWPDYGNCGWLKPPSWRVFKSEERREGVAEDWRNNLLKAG